MKNISFLLSKWISPFNTKYYNRVRSMRHSMILAVFFMVLSANLKADSGAWTAPNWSAFSISGASGCNTTSLTVSWNQWSFFCCSGCSNTYQYKATIELEYSANGTSGWSTVQTILKNGSPFSQTFTISATGYYRAWVFPEAKVLTGPCSPTGWHGTGQSSVTPSINITISSPAVANFNINGTAASCTALSLYNCVPIYLNNASTGSSNNNFQYRIFIYNSSSSCTEGTLVYSNGSNPVSSNPAYTNGSFASLDLRSLAGFQGNWLASHTGYFLVKLEVKNSCNGSASVRTGLINVSSTPGSITGSWTITHCPSGQVTPSNSCTTPTSVSSTGGAAVYADGAGSSIQSYTVSIQEVSGSTCTQVAGGLNLSHTYLKGGTFNDEVVSLNGVIYQETGISGWTSNGSNFGKKLKVGVYVTNVCGNSPTQFGYVTNNDPSCRFAGENPMLPDDNIIHVFPNPLSDEIHIDFDLAQDDELYLSLCDATGRKVKIIYSGQFFKAGKSAVTVNLSEFSEGIYYLKFQSENINIKEKLVKIQ